MALPTNRIKKIKLPGDVNGDKTYEIIPEKVSDGSGNYAVLPSLSADDTIAVKGIDNNFSATQTMPELDLTAQATSYGPGWTTIYAKTNTYTQNNYQFVHILHTGTLSPTSEVNSTDFGFGGAYYKDTVNNRNIGLLNLTSSDQGAFSYQGVSFLGKTILAAPENGSYEFDPTDSNPVGTKLYYFPEKDPGIYTLATTSDLNDYVKKTGAAQTVSSEITHTVALKLKTTENSSTHEITDALLSYIGYGSGYSSTTNLKATYTSNTSDVFNILLPAKSGTLAIDNDVVHKGSSSSSVAETIYGSKSFNSDIVLLNDAVLAQKNTTSGITTTLIRYNNGHITLGSSGGAIYSHGSFVPSNTQGYYSLGSSTLPWASLYLSGSIRDGNSNYGLSLPDSTSWTANKTIATTDQLPQIQRFI